MIGRWGGRRGQASRADEPRKTFRQPAVVGCGRLNSVTTASTNATSDLSRACRPTTNRSRSETGRFGLAGVMSTFEPHRQPSRVNDSAADRRMSRMLKA